MEKLLFKQYNKVSGIYKITDKIKGRIYIGSSKNLYDRIRIHIKQLNNNKHCNIHLQRFVNKYGIENLLLEIVELCDINKCVELEQKWIDNLNCVSPYGFNMCSKAFSVIGRKHSQEAKDKISKANKGKEAAFKGKYQTEACKEQISESKTKDKRPVYLKTEEEIKEFSSIYKASKYFNINPSIIHNNLKGLSKKTKQGIWIRKLTL